MSAATERLLKVTGREDYAVEYIEEIGGLYFRTIRLPKSGDMAPQHAHEYSHVTFLGHGSVLAFADGVGLGYFKAPAAILVEAGKLHEFIAQSDNTLLTCIHSVASAEAIKAKEW
jgi:hypothetical protein